MKLRLNIFFQNGDVHPVSSIHPLMAVDVPPSAKTNTLIITSLSSPFFHPRVQAALRAHFEFFGEIHTWAPITGLGRIMVVYWNEDSAECAKGLDGTVIGEEGQ